MINLKEQVLTSKGKRGIVVAINNNTATVLLSLNKKVDLFIGNLIPISNTIPIIVTYSITIEEKEIISNITLSISKDTVLYDENTTFIDVVNTILSNYFQTSKFKIIKIKL